MRRDIIAVGGSAGALDPLRQVVRDLPGDLPAAILVVVHMAATARSALAPILSRAGALQAVVPQDGDDLRPGYIYVAKPDHHLEVTIEGVRHTRGPHVNGARPAVDVLFRTAARVYGSRVAGVVLSGGLDDGSAGLAAIRAAGGVGIVQSPEDALVDSMPSSAIAVAAPEHVVPAARIAGMIVHVAHESPPADMRGGRAGGAVMEPVGAKDTAGDVTGITCPDCHGSIWMQTGDGGEVSLVCRIGHSYSPESFAEIQAANVENALWAGVRSLEEQASLAGVMASRALRRNDPEGRERFEHRRTVAGANAEILRRLVLERSDA